MKTRWIENFTLLIRSNFSTLKEKIEDPERMIHQLVLDMEEELDGVRESVAETITDEILMGKRAEGVRREARQWAERATSALQKGDEAASRKALEQKINAEERANSLEEEYGRQREATARLRDSVIELEDKIRQARQKRTLLVARMARADAERRVQTGIGRSAGRSAFNQFHRLESRVERAEARSDAFDRLEGKDPEVEDLEREFQKKEKKARIEEELEDLRRRIGDDRGAEEGKSSK